MLFRSKMVGQVQSASEQLANGITAPVTYNSGNSPVQEVQSTLSDVPALAGNIPVSPTGSSKAETLKKEKGKCIYFQQFLLHCRNNHNCGQRYCDCLLYTSRCV